MLELPLSRLGMRHLSLTMRLVRRNRVDIVQGVLAFLMTAFAGPGLISPDLANGALPLYFCRPFSRLEYVLGKASVLGILLSEITWVPGIVLFAVQASLAGPRWAWDHLWIAASLIVSSIIWIVVLALLAMALSAWVKWRIVAGALLLAVLFFGAGFVAGQKSLLDVAPRCLVLSSAPKRSVP